MYSPPSETQSIPLVVSSLKEKERNGRKDTLGNTGGQGCMCKWSDQLKAVKIIQKYVLKHYEKVMYFNIFYMCIKYRHIYIFN